MRIHIATSTGMAQTYKFDVDSSITIGRLKQLFLKRINDNKDVERMWFVINEEILDDDENTLLGCGLKDESVLHLIDLGSNARSDVFFAGAKFVDLSNNKGLKRHEWGKTAPAWLIARPGLCLEGLCTNPPCNAYKQRVIMSIGYKRFDILIDPGESTTKCPICKQYVEPKTCSFNNCWWRYQGIKQDEIGQGKPPKKCSSDWQQADNAYHYFDESASETVNWRQLTIEAVKDKPS